MDPNATVCPPAATELATLQQHLLAWFATAARDLPWRKTRDPYEVLVAEIMLQQTQVARVRPKYAAFLEAFPTLADLAGAPTAEVIRMWAGLGYNRRAVNLQRVARIITEEYNGVFPQEVARLKALPGIGDYTAGAIACFAFEQDIAFMDTNIRRVVQRCLVGPEESTPKLRDRDLLAHAQAAIPVGQGWTWNQAIMELGALVCTAAAPACWRCPVQQHCHAYTAWKQQDERMFQPAEAAGDGSLALQRGEEAPTPLAYTPPQRPMRRVAERPAEPFIGSNRYYRGRLIALLRTLAPEATLPLSQIGPQLKDTYHERNDAPWLHQLVDGLARDGLVELIDDHVRLPIT